jgi:hypothetical protein
MEWSEYTNARKRREGKGAYYASDSSLWVRELTALPVMGRSSNPINSRRIEQT